MYLYVGGTRSLLNEKTFHDNGLARSLAHSPSTENSNVMTLQWSSHATRDGFLREAISYRGLAVFQEADHRNRLRGLVYW